MHCPVFSVMYVLYSICYVYCRICCVSCVSCTLFAVFAVYAVFAAYATFSEQYLLWMQYIKCMVFDHIVPAQQHNKSRWEKIKLIYTLLSNNKDLIFNKDDLFPNNKCSMAGEVKGPKGTFDLIYTARYGTGKGTYVMSYRWLAGLSERYRNKSSRPFCKT
jgi:hypothetical protein